MKIGGISITLRLAAIIIAPMIATLTEDWPRLFPPNPATFEQRAKRISDTMRAPLSSWVLTSAHPQVFRPANSSEVRP